MPLGGHGQHGENGDGGRCLETCCCA
jgi:hypothetical protein